MVAFSLPVFSYSCQHWFNPSRRCFTMRIEKNQYIALSNISTSKTGLDQSWPGFVADQLDLLRQSCNVVVKRLPQVLYNKFFYGSFLWGRGRGVGPASQTKWIFFVLMCMLNTSWSVTKKLVSQILQAVIEIWCHKVDQSWPLRLGLEGQEVSPTPDILAGFDPPGGVA